ncbi:MAG: Uma2 family endonuclease [Pirellulales bacterium]|nr:Uma2 family endonuclease [Pirellulales bacterium]
MSSVAKKLISIAEFLELEQKSVVRHEYYRGEIFAMAGANASHNQISFNLSGLFYVQFRNTTCRSYVADMLVKCPSDLLCYPDLVVFCHSPQFADQRQLTLLNPSLLIEILSPTTEKYDRTIKFDHYATLESLRDYLLIAQDQPRIEHYHRETLGADWAFRIYAGLEDTLQLPDYGLRLPLRDIYERVEFPPPEPSPEMPSRNLLTPPKFPQS